MELSESQEMILGRIEAYWRKHGFGPAIRDLMRECGFRSPRAVAFHLDKLERMGLIEQNGKARSIRVRGRGVDMVDVVPIFGSIAAGPAEVQTQLPLGELAVPRQLSSAGVRQHGFALKVRGDSMIGAGIHDGDLAIVEQRAARPEDIVVALVDGQSTLKRLVKRRGGFCLKSENPKYPLIQPVERLEIQGVVVGIFRKI
ncbi:MAG TPA: transcriptional repressor LexA [Verrucomicrobiae bacterium]|nr:transcriptional repressor LexA [Verrucomicrobiae bacterium]